MISRTRVSDILDQNDFVLFGENTFRNEYPLKLTYLCDCILKYPQINGFALYTLNFELLSCKIGKILVTPVHDITDDFSDYLYSGTHLS